MLRALKLTNYRVPNSKPENPILYKKTEFEELEGKTIHNQNVILMRYANSIFKNGPIFKCHTLFLDECNENFIAYWLNRQTFPNVTTIFLNTPPCQSKYVLSNKFQEIYLHEDYRFCIHSWPDNNIKLISDRDYRFFVNDYEEENMLVTE